MRRHLVHSVVAALAVFVGLAIPAGRAEAQTGVGAAGGIGNGLGVLNDPFAFYYAIYLPNQQLQSMRPAPLEAVNDAMVSRQYYAQQSRRNLYDPISPYSDTVDPLRPYSGQQERAARPARFSRDPSNMGGMGPALLLQPSRPVLPRPGRAIDSQSQRQRLQAHSRIGRSGWRWNGRRGYGRWRRGWWHGYARDGNVLIHDIADGVRLSGGRGCCRASAAGWLAGRLALPDRTASPGSCRRACSRDSA